MRLPRLLCVALLSAGPLVPLPTQAQLSDDVHWFYEYGGPAPEPFAMAVQGHHLYMGGLFLNVDGDTEKKNFTRFNLQTEAFERVPGVTNSFSGGVWAIHAGDDGLLYLGGNITNTGGTLSSGIVSFNPATGTYAALSDPGPTLVTTGQANGPTNGRVFAIVKSGNLIYAGGEFTGPGGSPQNEKYIRSFNLTTRKWSRLGNGLNADVQALTLTGNGDLIAGGSFTGGVARWNGTTWSVIGGGAGGGFGGVPNVRALARSKSGVIYVGGDFDSVGTGANAVTVRDVAAWTGTAWLAMAGGFDANYVQANGTTFSSDGVFDLTLDGAGVLYAAGDFDASVGRTVLNLRHVARWDGTGAWKSLGSGLGTTGSQIVNCLAVGLQDDLYAGGVFNIGYGTLGAPSKNFARGLPTRDFTGYIPGVRDNPTSLLALTSQTAREVTLQTRPGTSYIIQGTGNLINWSDITGTSFTGNGTRQGFSVTGNAPNLFYRFRATGF